MLLCPRIPSPLKRTAVFSSHYDVIYIKIHMEILVRLVPEHLIGGLHGRVWHFGEGCRSELFSDAKSRGA
jgi:hypothetical protein